ncbi:DUF2255 family protein [Gordonia sp. VNK1]|uniref:DUF2255 family protein n=1 Tax=Gordonia oleivorans TaxID=3156618 RepID=UPI0032B4DF81
MDSSGAWDTAALRQIAAAHELRISTPRADGTMRTDVPIWVVEVDGSVFVRTWHRRDTGWFGAAVRTGTALLRIADWEREVAVADVGAADAGTRTAVDAAYRSKYGVSDDPTVSGMVTDDAAASTLRLSPPPSADPAHHGGQ